MYLGALIQMSNLIPSSIFDIVNSLKKEFQSMRNDKDQTPHGYD